ncbi:MAG: hypothetical protein N2319_02215 [Candidatus Kapabacteria bacterium]|nr:hypothetical protein [Candidatus Kapabacteria bacterium]
MKFLSILLFSIISYLLFNNNCCDPPVVCLEINPLSCPNANLNNSLLKLDEQRITRMWMNIYGNIQNFQDADHYIPYDFKSSNVNHIISAGYGETAVNPSKYVEGYEINYGFWSKDSYRCYTWAEMFKWKYGRDPTPSELENLTCEMVKQWFIERHTVRRSWPLQDDPPRDVNCIQPPIKKYCVTLNDFKYEYQGWITFANGKQCKLQSFSLLKSAYDGCANPHYYKINIEKPCSECI